MARPKSSDGGPTKMEMDILQVLWKDGPSTVRYVTDELNKEKEVAYTTTLKIMQLMHNKKLVHRDESSMTHIYAAAIKEDAIKKAMLSQFLKSVYRGSSTELMTQLLGSTKKPSKEELTLLKEFLKKYDNK